MTSISTLLVANRGEIAARVIRTASAMGIHTVAVYSDPDTHAPFVALADEAVRLAGASSTETYLRGETIIQAALETGADAIHPGYGFLSENAGFAQACADAGLIFVGPPPAAIAAMGSKLEAKARMEAAGVPVLPGTTVTEDTDLEAAGERIGYPLLVKAAFGGGGRGMRVVHSAAELAEAVASARREAGSAFGDATVFLERFVTDPRHVEVQIFGDNEGDVVHLFERECSIQRRYQKIVEECPSPAVDDELRAELGAAAVAAGKAIGYVGAGTVEFVLDSAGAFYFLEVNTRLQVEHPVTELVTGLDLVELQLRVAEGEPLPTSARDARIEGHAIEVRLYAEDVRAGFLPANGTLHRFRIDPMPGVRVDSGVADGSVVSTHYDPMLAKVIAHGPTRRDAARRLARALSLARIHGVTTNRDLLVGILREPDFLAGKTDTGYLTRHDPATLGVPAAGAVRLAAVASALAQQAEDRTSVSDRRYVSTTSQRIRYAVGEHEIVVAYQLGSPETSISVDGDPLAASRLIGVNPDGVDLEVGGRRRRYAVARQGDVTYVDGPEGSFELIRVPRFVDAAASTHVGSLLAPMPGTVLRVLTAEGETVTAGQPLVVLEAMKMEHTVSAPTAGTVTEVAVEPGDQVDTGQMMAVVTADDAGEVFDSMEQ
jgi:acetyl/propionyl-CoA carboxylase alpha subunit